MQKLASLATMLALASCSALPEWMGEQQKPPLEGKRVAINPAQRDLQVDASLSTREVETPERKAFAVWMQTPGDAEESMGNYSLSADKARIGNADAGKGKAWPSAFLPNIVADDDAVYAMDSLGNISAHSVDSLNKVIWNSQVGGAKVRESFQGGGLAVASQHLVAATGSGLIASFNKKDGALNWRRDFSVPFRSAPRITNGKIIISSLDNQVYALDLESGDTVWMHNGLSEPASFLGSTTPAAADGLIVAAYSSGEIFGLKADTGREAWAEVVSPPRSGSLSANLPDIEGDPVISSGIVYIAAGGQLIALDAYNGRRLWEVETRAVATPWVAGEYLYALTDDYKLTCILKNSGRVRWVSELYADGKEKDKLHRGKVILSGPVMADDKLYITRSDGVLLTVTPQTGAIASRNSIPSGVYTPPIIANGHIIVNSKSSQLSGI